MKPIYSSTLPQTEFDSTVHKILQSRRYGHLRGGIRDVLSRVRASIGDWFKELFKRMFPDDFSMSPNAVDRLSTIALIVGILAIIAIIVFIVVKVNKSFEKKKKIKEILGEKIDEKTTPTSLRDKANRFRVQGEFREAIRYDFIALLLLLHRANHVYLNESKTNEEIYQALAKNDFPMLEEFIHLIDTFNSSWYGYELCDSSNYEDWDKHISHVWSGVLNHEK